MSKLKNESICCARKRKYRSGRARKFCSPVRAAVVQLAVTPTGSPHSERSRSHLSQRQIASELNLSKGTVFNIVNDSTLKCYRRIETNKLTEACKGARKMKSNHTSYWSVFIQMNHGIQYCFLTNQAKVSAHLYLWTHKMSKMNVCTEVLTWRLKFTRRTYWSRLRATRRLLCATQMPLGTAKTDLGFIEGYAEDHDNIIASKWKKKTIHQKMYREEMSSSNVQWHQWCYD